MRETFLEAQCGEGKKCVSFAFIQTTLNIRKMDLIKNVYS